MKYSDIWSYPALRLLNSHSVKSTVAPHPRIPYSYFTAQNLLAAHQLMHRAPQTAQAPAHTALSTQPQDFKVKWWLDQMIFVAFSNLNDILCTFRHHLLPNSVPLLPTGLTFIFWGLAEL